MSNIEYHLDLEAIARREKKAHRGNWLAMAGTILISAIWIVPFYYLATSIFKTTEEYSLNHPLSLPSSVTPVMRMLSPPGATPRWVQG